MALTTSGLGERRQVGGRAVSLRREARNIRKAGGNPQQLLEAAALERLDQGSAIGSADRDVRLGRLEDRMQAGLLRRQRDAVIGRATEPRPTTGGGTTGGTTGGGTTGGQGGGGTTGGQGGGGMLNQTRATAQPPRESKIDGKPASEVLGEMRGRGLGIQPTAQILGEKRMKETGLKREDIDAGPLPGLRATLDEVISRPLQGEVTQRGQQPQVNQRGRQPQAAPPSTAGTLNTLMEDDDETPPVATSAPPMPQRGAPAPPVATSAPPMPQRDAPPSSNRHRDLKVEFQPVRRDLVAHGKRRADTKLKSDEADVASRRARAEREEQYDDMWRGTAAGAIRRTTGRAASAYGRVAGRAWRAASTWLQTPTV